MATIKLSQLHKSYGRVAVVHGIDLEIVSGEFVVVLGPSGCGKSTVLRMIAGLEAISSGTIAIDGEVVNALEPRQRGCAMVFQNYALYPHFTVADNIGYALKVEGVAKAERRRRVEEVAASLGLTEYLDRKPAELSGGQRQRVAMGRAMIRSPKVFLFDEPLSNLDAKLRGQMRLEIKKLHRRLGATSVFVTHDQIEAMTLADRIVVMNGGRIEQIGTPTDIHERPQSLFVAGFIGSPPMNLFEATVAGPGLARVGEADIATDVLAGVAAGGRVHLGIRPEDIRLATDGRHRLTVEVVEKLGSLQVLHGTVNGVPLAIQCGASEPAPVGGVVPFDMPHARLHAFSGETGARIATVAAA